MRDYIALGSSPTSESCAQVGAANYYLQAKRECLAFKHQLQRLFPKPNGAYLAVKEFPHDFGLYREVVCYYDTEDEQARDYAFRLESETPEYWDDEAKKELKEDNND